MLIFGCHLFYNTKRCREIEYRAFLARYDNLSAFYRKEYIQQSSNIKLKDIHVLIYMIGKR